MTVSAVGRLSGNLPADLTTFVGRRHELADVKVRLSNSRLVTLTGVGGVGKTRLALRVAWEVRRTFRDGVWFVELAGLRDPGLIEQTLAASLGLHDRSSGRSMEWLLDQLAKRELLIVLDNCEHLLQASAVVANSLLRACRGVRILATSRQALGIDGERLTPLLPLSAPPASEPTSPDALLRYEAVALFVERATAVQPGFRVDPANQLAVAAICRRLDGIPLAVELAASRLRALSVDELMTRLDNRYAVLTGGSRAALPRQQTLRALVDWSFDLCSPPERLLWARLSTFAGGFDLAAAELVCSDARVPSHTVWELVTQLVDKSIVLATDDGGGLRYHLTETLRDYGRERLREFGETAKLRARHFQWARQLVILFDAGWFGADQVGMLIRLRREHRNLREALDFCLANRAEAAAGLEMTGALRFYWLVTGRVSEGRHWLDQLLTVSGHHGPARVRALCAAGYLATMVSDFSAADSLLDEAEALGAQLDDRSGTALAIQVEALTALFRGDPQRAAPLFQTALDSHREIGDESAAIYDEVELALCTALLGDADTATAMLEECLIATQARGEHWLRALTLWALGIEQCKVGDHQGAESSELASLRLRRTLDDRSTIGMNLQVLGWIAAAQGEGERGARLLGASEGVAQSMGLSLGVLGHLRDLQQTYQGAR
jgi:predicted ATPase